MPSLDDFVHNPFAATSAGLSGHVAKGRAKNDYERARADQRAQRLLDADWLDDQSFSRGMQLQQASHQNQMEMARYRDSTIPQHMKSARKYGISDFNTSSTPDGGFNLSFAMREQAAKQRESEGLGSTPKNPLTGASIKNTTPPEVEPISNIRAHDGVQEMKAIEQPSLFDDAVDEDPSPTSPLPPPQHSGKGFKTGGIQQAMIPGIKVPKQKG